MRRSFYNRYVGFLKRYQNSILLVTAIMSILFGFFATQVKILNALDNMLPENDPDLVRFEKFNKTYGGDFIVMVGIKADEIFDPKILKVIATLTNKLEKLSEVDSVISLSNAQIMRIQNEDLVLENFITDYPKNQNEILAYKKRALNEPYLKNYVVPNQKSVTALYVTLTPQENLMDKKEARNKVISFLNTNLKELKSKNSFEYFFSGNAALEYELDVSSQRTQILSTFTIVIILSLILYLLFYHVRGVILILFQIALAVLWTVGFIAMVGKSLNFVTTLLPSLILIVSVLDGIHIYAVFRKQSLSVSRQERMVNTFSQTFIPCLLTTVTTAIGFGSLILSEVAVIRDFGLFAVFGILVAFFLTVLPLPVIMLMMTDEAKSKKQKRVSPIFQKIINGFYKLYQEFWAWNLGLFLVLLLTIGFGCFFLVIEDDPISHYNKDHPIRQGFDFFDSEFGGSTTADIIIEGPEDFLKNPKYLKQIEKFQKDLENTPHVTFSISIVDLLKKSHQTLMQLDEAVLPKQSNTISQIFLLLESQDGFSKFVNHDRTSMRINTRLPALGSRHGKAVVDKTNILLKQTILPPLSGYVAGSNVVWMNMGNYISSSLLKSFSMTLVLITLIMSFLLRSLKWGILSMIPNIMPIALTFGIMGWQGANLNLITLMIASIGIGVAVDDTIHMITHIRNGLNAGKNLDDVIQNTFDKVGVPVLTTSIVLFFGFLTLLFSDFKPAMDFGFFTALTVLLAMLSDLILLPALVRFSLVLKKINKT